MFFVVGRRKSVEGKQMRITIRHKFYSKQAEKKQKKSTFFLRGSGFVYGLSNTDIQASVTFFLVSIMNREQERRKKKHL